MIFNMVIDRQAFLIPFLNISVYWYGIFFALGIFMASYCLYVTYRQLFPDQSKEAAKAFVEKLSLYIVVGTVVGARLGHVMFYENFYYYLMHPHMILNVREGGLASHGAVVGIFVAMALFKRLDWLTLLDLLVMPAAVAGFFIRIGNFINQEIIGTVTNLPWAVSFPMNFEGLSSEPRHPVQIYEALYCVAIFALLFSIWKKMLPRLNKGALGSIFLIALFIGRFFFEFVKEGQSNGSFIPESHFSIGQWLSIPLTLLGFCLLFFSNKNGKLLVYKESREV
jgi:phosphatidylglycerol:prolipoprotein diacylglycerol transferase